MVLLDDDGDNDCSGGDGGSDDNDNYGSMDYDDREMHLGNIT